MVYRPRALARRCSNTRVRLANIPVVRIHTKRGVVRQVRVMTQESGAEDVIMQLQIAANDAGQCGAQVY